MVMLISKFVLTPQTNLQDQAARDKALQQMASMSSAQIVSASAIHNKAMGQGLPGLPPGVPPSSVRPSYPGAPSVSAGILDRSFSSLRNPTSLDFKRPVTSV